MNMNINRTSLIFTGILIAITCIVSGCARTVTDLNQILEIEFKLKFNSPPDSSKYNYYILFSKTSTPKTPSEFSPPESESYFPTPGRDYSPNNFYLQTKGDISYFYQTYFSTWSDYLIYSQHTASLYNANSINSASTYFPSSMTEENHKQYLSKNGFNPSISTNGNTLIINFKIEDAFQSIPNSLHFNFLTTSQSDTTKTGQILDFLTQEQNSFLVIKGKAFSKEGPFEDTDNYTPSPPASADLLEWEVQIF